MTKEELLKKRACAPLLGKPAAKVVVELVNELLRHANKTEWEERDDIDYVRLYRSHENGKWHAKNGSGDYMHPGCFDTAAECIADVMRPRKKPRQFT